ncbi:MAG: ubiquinol-cytochrome c reductase iron-sulfur subunit [Candidatus Brocadiales bacterium]
MFKSKSMTHREGAIPLGLKRPSRRQALWTALWWSGWGVIFGMLCVAGATLVRFLYPRATYEPSKVFKAKRPEQYAMGSVNLVPGRKVWIIREERGFYALLAICTHLGCQPVWYESQQIFKCPCHGSRFYKDGINFAGPAPRPLERMEITLASDGRLVVNEGKAVDIDYFLNV